MIALIKSISNPLKAQTLQIFLQTKLCDCRYIVGTSQDLLVLQFSSLVFLLDGLYIQPLSENVIVTFLGCFQCLFVVNKYIDDK